MVASRRDSGVHHFLKLRKSAKYRLQCGTALITDAKVSKKNKRERERERMKE